MMKRLLGRLVVLVVGLVVGVGVGNRFIATEPNQAQAQGSDTLIGTHLGYGDVGHQRALMDHLKENGAQPGFPVTMLLNMHASENEVATLSDGIITHEFFPIIRIEKSCDPGDANRIVELVRKYFNPYTQAKFGQSVVITFGNELNLYNNNCSDGKNWGQYAANWDSIANKTNLSPAAIAQYDPGPNTAGAAPASELMAAIGDVYSGNSIRTANGYGCQNETSCNIVNTNTHAIAYADISGVPMYLTEFSLSPGNALQGKSNGAPDNDLNLVREFIETRGREPSIGAVKITPLIRNVCENVKDEWLLYVNGNFLSSEGELVDPDNCELSDEETDAAANAKLRGENETFYPIENLEKALLSASTAKDKGLKVAQALAEAGYNVTCAARESSADQQFVGAVERYMELFGEDTVLDVITNHSASADSGEFPFLRDNEQSSDLLSSLENLDSLPLADAPDAYSQSISNAQVMRRLSLKDQCFYKLWNLKTRQVIGAEYEDPGQNTGWLPTSSGTYNLKHTLDRWNASKMTCDDYGKPYEEVLTSVGYSESEFTRSDYTELKDRMKEVPLNLEGYSTLACLVVGEDQRADKTDFFARFMPFLSKITFFRGITDKDAQLDPWPDDDPEIPRHKVQYACFRVPAFLFNKSPEVYQYHEPQEVAYYSQVPQNLVENYNAVEKEARKDLLRRIQAIFGEPFNSDKLVLRPKDQISIENPFARGLVNMVNGQGDACTLGFSADSAQQIASDTGYDEVDLHTSKTGLFNWWRDLFRDLETKEPEDPTNFIQSLASKVRIARQPKQEEDRKQTKAGIHMWLVSRQGGKNSVSDLMQQQVLQPVLTQVLLDKIAEVEGQLAAAGDVEAAGATIFGGDNLAPPYAAINSFHSLDSPVTQGDPFLDTEDPACEIITNPDGTQSYSDSCYKEYGAFVGGETEGVAAKINEYCNKRTRYLGQAIYPFLSAQWNKARNSNTCEEYLLGIASSANPDGVTTGGTSGGGTLGNLQPVAQCQAGSARITSGEQAVHVCSNTGQPCSAGEAQTQSAIFDSATHDIPNWKNPNDPVINCADLYSYAACTYKDTLVQNPVNSAGEFSQSGNQTACEYVISTAKQSGISPRLTLAVWGEETGFGAVGGAMFGYNPGQNDKGLGYQLSGFINLVKSAPDYESFLLKYSSLQDLQTKIFSLNPLFPGRVKDYYNHLGPR